MNDLPYLSNLDLTDTQITDLTPLKDLPGLLQLRLSNVPIIHITPLQDLSALQLLYLDTTWVQDLRPIVNHAFDFSDDQSNLGIEFRRTPFAMASKEAFALSNIRDSRKRTDQTLAYLRTLPPYPEPLPWHVPVPNHGTRNRPADIPTHVKAPISIAEVEGQLRLVNTGGPLNPDGSLIAKQGWNALRDYLDDLSDQRNRIDNALPRLGKCMSRLDAALGNDFDAMNTIAVGTQSSRFMRLSQHASDALMDEDASDIEEFAAAITMFLERFPDWRAYRDAALATPINATAAQRSVSLAHDIIDALKDRDQIAPEIPAALTDVTNAVNEDPDDAIASQGMIASLNHLMAALAEKTRPLWKGIAKHTGDIAQMTGAILKKGTATSLALAAADIFANKATALHLLATTYPQQLGWLVKVLRMFGL